MQPRSNLPPEPNVTRCPNPRCGALKDANTAVCPHCGERYCPSGHLLKPYSRICRVCNWEDRNFKPSSLGKMAGSVSSKPDETKTHKVQYECPQCHNPVEEGDKRCPICGWLADWQYSGEFRDKKTLERVPDIVSPVSQRHLDNDMGRRTPVGESASSQLKDFAHKDWKHNVFSSDSVLVHKKKDRRDRGWGNKAAGTTGGSSESSKDRLLVAVRIAAVVVFIAIIAFVILMYKENIQSAISSVFSKSTPTIHVASDVVPPEIDQISASEITQDSVIITWVTDEPATSQVEYGTSTNYGSATDPDEKLVTTHNVKLSALSPGTTYYFAVMSKDTSGNPATYSTVEKFTTATPPDTTPPIISEVKIADVSDSTITITWVTDEEATSQVDYGKTASYGYTIPPVDSLITNHSVTLSGLEADKTYYFRVKSKDASGNEAVFDANQSFKTLSPISTGPSVGKRAPDFTVYNLDGDQSVTLSKLRGKIVMVNFWAPSCGACVAEMPEIDAVYKTWSGSKELEVIAIGGGYEIYIRNMIEEEGWTLPIFHDPDGIAFESYQISNIPRTFFIDTKGIIRKIELGRFDNKDQIIEALNSLQ